MISNPYRIIVLTSKLFTYKYYYMLILSVEINLKKAAVYLLLINLDVNAACREFIK